MQICVCLCFGAVQYMNHRTSFNSGVCTELVQNQQLDFWLNSNEKQAHIIHLIFMHCFRDKIKISQLN